MIRFPRERSPARRRVGYNALLVNSNSTPFRISLDRLTHDFIEGVLQAFRDAPLGEFLDFLAEAGPSLMAHPLAHRLVEPPREVASSAPRRAPRTPGAARPPRASASSASSRGARPDADDIEHGDPASIITDPGMMLAALQVSSVSAPQALPAILRDAKPASEPPPHVAPPAPPPPRERAAAPALRPGEEVLRTAGGGHVLRRRPRSAPTT